MRRVAERFDHTNLVSTDFYELGKGFNGAIFLDTPAGRIEWFYQNTDQVERVIIDAKKGKFEWCFQDQVPYGYFSVMHLAYLKNSIPLYDPDGIIKSIQQEIISYPKPLRKAIINDFLEEANFTCFHGTKYAKSGDIYATIGCITRILCLLSQVLFALNKIYFSTEKMILEKIMAFSLKPRNYESRIKEILNCSKKEEKLEPYFEKLKIMINETIQLCDPLYVPKPKKYL